jgi:hypothetical protein
MVTKTKEPVEDEKCKVCVYKILVEKAMKENPNDPIPFVQSATTKAPVVGTTQQPAPVPEKKGALARFSAYIAKNQAANRAAGETSLSDELSNFGKSYGKGISEGAASLGMEEIANVNKRKSDTAKRNPKDDDDLIDFLSGKRPKNPKK